MKITFQSFLLLLIFMLLSCDQVNKLLDLDKVPELDENGIIVSADRVAPGDTITASISATNPLEGPLTYSWKKTGGEFVKPYDTDVVRWLSFTGGTYTLKVTVKNDDGNSPEVSKQVEVLSADRPFVDIVEPEKNTYFVAGQEITVRARAEHENGVALVKLFVNDIQIDGSVQKYGAYYQETFTASEEMVGTSTIEIRAESSSHVAGQGSDFVQIEIGGIVLGK